MVLKERTVSHKTNHWTRLYLALKGEVVSNSEKASQATQVASLMHEACAPVARKEGRKASNAQCLVLARKTTVGKCEQ